MRCPPDRHAFLCESVLAQVRHQSVEQLRGRHSRFDHRPESVQRQARALRMRAVVGINGGRRGLAQRRPPCCVRDHAAGDNRFPFGGKMRRDFRDFIGAES